MARLLKGDKMAEPPRGRRLSFKTKASSDRKVVRAVRVTVPSNSVAAIASKFNAVVVEDEAKGRAILKKLNTQQSGSVKAAVQKFEGLQGHPKMVLVRTNSAKVPEKPQETRDGKGVEPTAERIKPKVYPKPNIDRKANSRYIKKDLKELLGKEKKFSLPKTQILDEVLNESSSENKNTKPPNKTETKKEPTNFETSVLSNDYSEQVEYQQLEENIQIINSEKNGLKQNTTEPIEHEPPKEVSFESETFTKGDLGPTEKSQPDELSKTKATQPSLTQKPIRPNSSFLWGAKEMEDPVPTMTIVIPVKLEEQQDTKKDVLIESSVDDKENLQLSKEVSERLVENKENMEKLETPIVRTVDKKGYGKINVQANSSSLYRNILKQAFIDEIKEKLENKEKMETKAKNAVNERNEVLKDKTENVNEPIGYKNVSERSYEVIEQNTYELVGFENSYDVIDEYDKEEAIYDDVHLAEGIYESIYNGRLQNDSDSSCEQNNSLYDARPPSQASSGGSGGMVAGGASRSDTSDDWVDIELDSAEEQKEQIVILQGTPRVRTEGWSVKVRRQWSSRSVSRRVITDDSDGSSKHYELVDNPDDDSALCDDFDDSSDSEFSVDNNYKPNVQERLRPEVNQSDGIYSLMKEAGKRMRKTSSTIGKSLRRISRISKTTSAQDIFNGGNGITRGKWPSFKKKAPQANSTFYLNETNEKMNSSTPPPRPPPPALADTRRLSMAVRPTSPPPPPPVYTNGDVKAKPINDTSLYAECGLFEQNHGFERRSKSNSWYSDIGLYENIKPFDTASEHDSSQGSDIDLRFADEPLYQFYTECVAKQELNEDISETGYEEIGENRSSRLRPSALELVSPEMHRTLWCQVPQVIDSGILDTLSPEKKKLQEAKFEVVTSEASYYKSLSILEKHFAASPQLKDESILPKVHYKTFFGNVLAVRKCSEAVLAALEKCWQESILLEGISDVINQIAEEHFSAYIKYCKHQLAIERTLKSLKKTNQGFVDALENLQKSPKCHNLTFYSFVLLPMQRITRMPLLLDAILTKLTPDDAEYDSCQVALARLNKIVHECNEAARQTERLEEMAILSSTIHFPPGIRPLPLLSASRWLVRSGDLSHIVLEAKATFGRRLTAAKAAKLRLFLFTDYLVITKKKGEDNFMVVTYCERNLVQMTDVEEPIPNRFLIMLTLLKNHEGKTQEMMMCCGGESSRARWISALSPPAPSNPGETLYEDWDCPQVCATHAYVASQPDELSLQNGDVMNVLRKTADGWYYGERIRDAEKGWFPGNYTVEILSSHVRARNLKQRYRLLALSSTFIQKQQMNKAAG